MEFIKKCLEFLADENKEVRKNFNKIKYANEKDLLQEGTAIVNAVEQGDNTFSFPAQFIKLREDQSVILFDSETKKKVGSGEITHIDYIKHTVEIDMNEVYNNFNSADSFLIIQDNCIFPKAVVDSLTKMVNDESIPQVVQNIINRKPNIKAKKQTSIENVIQTANEMNNSFMVIHGPPGAGKTYTAKKVMANLLQQGKTILVTSNSHSAINNLIDSVEITSFKGAKISSRQKYNANHKAVKNIQTHGDEIDRQIDGYQLVGGTCFALAKIKEKKFDYLFIDEASQIKLSFILAVAKVAENVIIMGDHLQLTSISAIPITPHGDAVLNYILEDHQILPQKYGYFLDTTYRCEPQIAKAVSEVYYQGKLKWSQTKKKKGFTVVKTEHNLSAKMNETEGKAVLKIYKGLLKDKIKPEDIMIIAPYNAQVSYLKSLIKNDKVAVGTVDIAQGRESKCVIMSFTVAGKSSEDAAFVTNSNRVNVAISRAKDQVFLVMSNKLATSEFITPTFQRLLKIVDTQK